VSSLAVATATRQEMTDVDEAWRVAARRRRSDSTAERVPRAEEPLRPTQRLLAGRSVVGTKPARSVFLKLAQSAPLSDDEADEVPASTSARVDRTSDGSALIHARCCGLAECGPGAARELPGSGAAAGERAGGDVLVAPGRRRRRLPKRERLRAVARAEERQAATWRPRGLSYRDCYFDELVFRDPDVWSSTITRLQSGVLASGRRAGEGASRRSSRATVSRSGSRRRSQRRSGAIPSHARPSPAAHGFELMPTAVGVKLPPKLRAAGVSVREDLRKKFRRPEARGMRPDWVKKFAVLPAAVPRGVPSAERRPSALAGGGIRGSVSVDVPAVLLRPGNCILAALWHLAESLRVDAQTIMRLAREGPCRDRDYVGCLCPLAVAATALDPGESLAVGAFLLHCTALLVRAEPAVAVLIDGDSCVECAPENALAVAGAAV